VNTVRKRAPNRNLLNGGAARNSTRLGLADVYSTSVNSAAHSATMTANCPPSDPAVGSIIDGVTINSTTSAARKSAPDRREITASLPSFRSDAIRCRALVPFISCILSAGCLIVAIMCPLSNYPSSPCKEDEKTTAVLGRWWCEIATISKPWNGYLGLQHNMWWNWFCCPPSLINTLFINKAQREVVF